MKPNEIRIGNLINFDSITYIVIELLNYEIKALGLNEGAITLISYDKIEPIELTPEWLERIGLNYLRIFE